MIMLKKKFGFAFLASMMMLLGGTEVFGQTIPRKVLKGQEAWRYLKKAKDSFESNDFGMALEYAEKGKEIRAQDAAWQTYILENTLKKYQVRREGDSLDAVKPVLEELELFDALDVIDFQLSRKGSDYFDNSFSKIISEIPEYSHYPEADYLIGKIYSLEGEFSVASKYMEDALKYSMNFDVPMEKYDLLYDLATISNDLGRFEDYEKYLLLIIKDDMYYKNPSFMKALLRVISEDENESVEKFFLLYRYQNDIALRAFIELSEFYSSEGLEEKALSCSAIAAIISVTKIENVLKERITDYSYSTFADMLLRCGRFGDIIDWGNKNEVWKLFGLFGSNCMKEGKIMFARRLFTILSENHPDDYWKKYAERKLVK